MRDVSVSDVTRRPAVAVAAVEFFIQGDTEESRGDELRPTGVSGCVDGLIRQTSAIGLIIYPVIEGTSRDDASSPIICVLIHALQGNQWIFLSGDTGGHIHVYSLLVHVHSIDPSADLGRSDREVDVGWIGSITHVQVSVDLCVEETHCLYLVFEIEGGSDAAIAVETSGHFGEDAIETSWLGGLCEGIKRSLTCEDSIIELTEGVAETTHSKEKEGNDHNPKISYPKSNPAQMDTSLASIYFEEMRSDHSHHDNQPCYHDEYQNGLD